jgi:hypothetical protein
MFKHVGKMKHNNAKVCIIYRTLPGDASSALVLGTAQLSDTYHNSLMTLVESADGQQSNELGDALSSRYFPDGNNMLQHLHLSGKLAKVPTAGVLVTPSPNTEISLDELNLMIAEQKGVTLDQLAIKSDLNQELPKNEKLVEISEDKAVVPDLTPEERAVQYRNKAAELMKVANELQAEAEALVSTIQSKTKRKKTDNSGKETKEVSQSGSD